MTVGQLLLFGLPLFPPLWVFMLVGIAEHLRTHRHLQNQDLISYPDDQNGSKGFVLVTSWVHPCPLSPLEMASGTHFTPAPGLTR